MKAWRISSHGGSEVLQRVDVSVPTPKSGEALIRIHTVGLNHLDVWVRKGVEGHRFPLPLIPGCDMVGAIESFGPDTPTVLPIGSNVIVNPGVSCGRCEACLGGFDPLCNQYGIFGETQNGGCTDFVSVPIQNLIEKPATLSNNEAASLGIPYLTAWTMLVNKAKLQAGDLVLIHAAGSGVSIAAIQIAKLLGATILTTVGSPEKAMFAKNLGVHSVIEYKKVSFREEVKKISSLLGKKGCDVVVDHVGSDTFQDSLRSLAWGGKFVTCGATSGSKVNIDLKAIFFKNISILGSTMGSKSDLLKIVRLAAQKLLVPKIDSTFPMDQLPQALEKIEKRKTFGKVIMTQDR